MAVGLVPIALWSQKAWAPAPVNTNFLADLFVCESLLTTFNLVVALAFLVAETAVLLVPV